MQIESAQTCISLEKDLLLGLHKLYVKRLVTVPIFYVLTSIPSPTFLLTDVSYLQSYFQVGGKGPTVCKLILLSC